MTWQMHSHTATAQSLLAQSKQPKIGFTDPKGICGKSPKEMLDAYFPKKP